jgi:hypothetical protein
MGKTWVLHTETKGTGAQVVPLEKAAKKAASVEPEFVRRRPAPDAEPQGPPARGPHSFRIVDVLTRQVLAEGTDTRTTLGVLRGVRSLVDVNVYVWQEERERWRLLTLGEQRALLDLARA